MIYNDNITYNDNTCFDAGRLCDSSETYEGELDIPNLSEENDPDDVDVSSMIRSASLCHTAMVITILSAAGCVVQVHSSSNSLEVNHLVVDVIFTFKILARHVSEVSGG